MRFVDVGELPVVDAVDALERAFAGGLPELPLRAHHTLPDGGELLLMPAWGGDALGVKLVTLEPRNAARGLPLIHGVYVAFDAERRPAAVLDGAALTLLRTAAVSALATRLLALPDADRLLVFGAGAQARAHVEAMCAVRPVRELRVVGRDAARAEALVEHGRSLGLAAAVGTAADAGWAQVICTCTTSATPLFDGALLAPGAHVNAIGAYRPDLREVDGVAVARSAVFVEERSVARAEAGDLVLAARDGAWDPARIAGDLVEAARGAAGRPDAEAITLFKSVGMAFEDLVVAAAALRAA